MLKAETKKGHTTILADGNIVEICTDLACILRAINESLTNKSPEAGHAFKVAFTGAFMKGTCFDDDREHMNHYLAEAEKAREDKPTGETLDDLCDRLKDFNDFLDGLLKSMGDEE